MPAGTTPTPRSPDRAVAGWLFACAALVLAMVIVGGVTRLTRSGLSIVEWQPVSGVVPPIGRAAWERAFEAYRATPEARLENAWMGLGDFQRIYLVEYTHRLLGRITGVVFIVPLVVFAVRRRLALGRASLFVGLFALGGLQGALGWYMVKSGLVDAPRVSPYRLTSHLLVALVLFACLVWAALEEVASVRPAVRGPRPLVIAGWATLTFLGLTIAWGGFTAGLRAGAVCPTFPTMCGAFVPDGLLALAPGHRNLFENALTVQFVHRAIAACTALAATLTAWLAWTRPTPPRARVAAGALAALVAVQITLGVLTVMARVPLGLASAHQANAVLALFACVTLLHGLRGPRPAEARDDRASAGISPRASA